MRRYAPALSALALAAAPCTTQATDWLCNLSEDLVQLVCIADTDPMLPTQAAASMQAVVHGVAFPLDATLVYTVPLWTPPSDAEWVALLARSTICFRSPGCTVTLAPTLLAQMPTARVASSRTARRR